MNYSMVLIFVLAQSILLGNKQEESQQKQDLYCGVECLYMAMVSLDLYHQPFVKLKSSLGEVSPRGYSLESLRIEAERNGCHTLVASTEELVRAGLPKKCFAVVHEKPMHFQIVQKTNGPFEKHKCTATFKAIAMKPGLYTGRLRILSSERVELNSIPWSVRLLPPIELYPNRLLIEAVKSQAAEIRVSVESKLQGTLTVWSKECGAIPFDSEPHIGNVRDVKLQLPADFEDSQIYFQIEDKTAILEIERIQ